MPNEELVVTVDRSRWLRGSETNAKLRTEATGHSCVLGFWCLAEKIAQDEITGYLDTQQMEMHGAIIPERIARATNHADPLERIEDPTAGADGGRDEPLSVLCHVNDSSLLEDERRERLLRKIAPHLGIRLRFRGRRLPPFWRGMWRDRSAAALTREQSPPGPFEIDVTEYRRRRGQGRWHARRRYRTYAVESAGQGRKLLAQLLDRSFRNRATNGAARIRGRAPDGKIVFDRYEEDTA